MRTATYDEARDFTKTPQILLKGGQTIPNPHSDGKDHNYLRDMTPWPEGKQRVKMEPKMRAENANYDKKTQIAPGLIDLGIQSNLESRSYAYHLRFGNYVEIHPEKFDLGHGVLYTPDLLCTAKTSLGTEFKYYVEPHSVVNIDEDFIPVEPGDVKSRRLVKADIQTRAKWLTQLTGIPVKLLKPNHYFQIVQIDPITKQATVYSEQESCECYCERCGSFYPAVNPMPDDKCPLCGNSRTWTIVAFGDASSPGNITTMDNPEGIYARDRDYFNPKNPDEYVFRPMLGNSFGLWEIASECDVTQPIRGELRPQLRHNMRAK